MDLQALLLEFTQANGISLEDAKKALQWVAHPTTRPVVGVREFLESPYYMGTKRPDGTSVLYPNIVTEIERMNSGDYDEAVLTGGIGSGKTTCALYTTAYQLYKLSCYENPHELFQLDPSSEIVFIFQSVSAKSARTVDYERFRAMIEMSPYFREHFQFDKDLESELIFPKRIIVRPVSSKDTAAIGQNVFGGIIDEINFMDVVERSKQSLDGGTYDQAIALYNSISKRRKSRFSMAGEMPGVLCLVSSARYPGQFTDQKKEEAQRQLTATGRTSIYIFDKRTWDVKPPEFFMKERFWVFIGDPTRQPKVFLNKELATPEEQSLMVEVPMDYLDDFERDIMGSLRDIAGVSTVAKHPFFVEVNKVAEAFGKTQNLLSKSRSTLQPDDSVHVDLTKIRNKTFPRFAHIDLALTGDSAGLVIGHVEKFVEVQRGFNSFETLPYLVMDVVLEVPPPKGGEILIHRIRDIIYTLRDKVGLPIKWVTLDSFQSKDTMQLMKQRGFISGYQSVDLTIDPYMFLKSAFYDQRIELPLCDKLHRELISLEKNTKTNKIDHPPNGSKDIADALAGVVYGLTMRREIWGVHGALLSRTVADATKKPSERAAV